MSKRRRHSATKRELFVIIDRLEKRIAEMEAEVARLRKNSCTSSKRPCSDIVKPRKPPKANGGDKCAKGGQPGHPKHERPPFSPEQIDAAHEYTLEACPDCGGVLTPGEEAPRLIQQVEIVRKPVRIEEHRGLAYWCARC